MKHRLLTVEYDDKAQTLYVNVPDNVLPNTLNKKGFFEQFDDSIKLIKLIHQQLIHQQHQRSENNETPINS